MRYIGVLSGTSMDAVDVALAEFEGERLVRNQYRAFPFEPALRSAFEYTLTTDPAVRLSQIGEADVRLGVMFADAVGEFLRAERLQASSITALGSHGQTILHRPEAGFSLQLGDPNIIAERTGIVTVSDFRRMDLAAGGQGAPLAPAFHAFALRSTDADRAVLNIGGIANLTWLPADRSASVSGFDTGPGNALLDQWASRHIGTPYDLDGRWGMTGQVVPGLLDRLLADRYFTLAPPKTTGRDRFSLEWLNAAVDDSIRPQDVQATLVELTARSVALGIKAAGYAPAQLLVCGGGAHNSAILAALQAAIPACRVSTTAEAGLDPDAVEALLFAWLAMRRLQGLPGNLPSVTGARRAVPLGAIYAPN